MGIRPSRNGRVKFLPVVTRIVRWLDAAVPPEMLPADHAGEKTKSSRGIKKNRCAFIIGSLEISGIPLVTWYKV